jgi:hypothetical protein
MVVANNVASKKLDGMYGIHIHYAHAIDFRSNLLALTRHRFDICVPSPIGRGGLKPKRRAGEGKALKEFLF